MVEDWKGTRITLTALFEEEGYKVKACETAEEAMKHITTGEPLEIVLSDLKLPDGDGLQIFWALKKINPDVAFILITGHATLETAIQAVNEGVFAYHVKPVDIDALSGSVRNAIRQQRLFVDNRIFLERIHQSNLELERKNRVLQQACVSKTEVLSTPSQDLNWPLTSIVCHVDGKRLRQETVAPWMNDK